ncbi:MAG: hypothetical protein KBD01_05865 [Acidobacteria bacterium]|nr:hypothetical protein [Acidobacteriota bacterium]
MRAVEIPLAPPPTCAADCRLLGYLVDGALTAIAGEDGCPPCADCLQEFGDAGDPGRPKAPRRAEGSRGELVTCGWPEALDSLAFAIRDAASGTGQVLWVGTAPRPRVLDALVLRAGHLAPRWTIVRRQPPGETAARELAAVDGDRAPASPGELAAADVLVFWGCDVDAGPAAQRHALLDARTRGARVVWVDPAPPTGSALAGDLVLQLRPATDVALVLGLARLALESGRRDCPPELEARAGHWTPARVAEVTGVSAAALHEAGQLLAGARRPVVTPGGGPCRHATGADAVRGVALFARWLGAPVGGPRPAPDPAAAVPLPVGPHAPAVLPSGRLAGALDSLDASRTILLIDAAGPPDLHGSAALEEFAARAALVVRLSARAPGGGRAGLALPLAGAWEQADAVGLRQPAEVRASRACRAAPREALPAAELWRGLARRLGWPETWFPSDAADLLGFAAAAARRAPGTPAPGPLDHAESGEGPVLAPELFRAHRLLLVPRAGRTRRGRAPALALSPEDAAARSIGDGDAVVVHNTRGSIAAVARVVAGRRPGIVDLPWDAGPGPDHLDRLLAVTTSGSGEGETPGCCLVEVEPSRA